MRPLGPRARPAFTLIELLVVIGIIGILAAILIVGVIPLLGSGTATQTTSDLSQLNEAISDFKGKFGVLPPSKITLSANSANVDATSMAYLNTMWPRLDWTTATVTLDWGGTGLPRNTLRSAAYTYTLEGDQCLVFFLGGIPDQTIPGCKGFSSNPKNPTDLTTGTKHSSFNFPTNRLYQRTTTQRAKFYSYKDPWGKDQPYVYFSSGRRKDGYTAAPGDCSSLMPGGPYYEAGSNPIRYFNSTTCQIISAGKDGLFGPGGSWSPANATAISKPGADDQANFYNARLGVAQ